MPAFLKSAADRLGYLGPEPDRWRDATDAALKQFQEPDHFIDLERVAPLGELPPGRYDFIRLLYSARAAGRNDALLPERVGMQPYITMEIYERLKVAFGEYRRLQRENQSMAGVQANIIFYAGWLGHYVSDGAQPLHTTVNYDGWVEPNPRGYTTQKGIHARFETDFIAQAVKPGDFLQLVGPPTALQNPFREYMAYLWQSHGLMEDVYRIDKAGGFAGLGSAEARMFTLHRMAAASQMLLNLWYTAWIESEQRGSPKQPVR